MRLKPIDDSDDEFRLANHKPRSKTDRFDRLPPAQQGVLFAGMDCMPGQLDLFETDGPPVYDPQPPPQEIDQ